MELLAALLLLGCSERAGAPAASTPEPQAEPAAGSGRPAPPAVGADGLVERRHGLSWYEDAPDAAFEAARAAGKRVVVDLWAPWCHTCLSMQSVVLTSDNLPGAADRFVWLALDTERESNASWLERLPVAVWPTFYVVDPKAMHITGRWLGAASPAQFSRFLEDGDRDASPTPDASAELLRRASDADTLAARGQHTAAARAYAELLRDAPRDWSRRPDMLVAEMTALSRAKDWAACLDLGAAALDQTGRAASSVDFSYYALDCADHAPPGSRDALAVRSAVAARLEPLCREGSAELSPDDRADACDKLAAARAALGQIDAGRDAILHRLQVLEQAAAGKPAEQALTYDWARTDALLQLGRPEDALALAAERERQLPDNYNPPHYRAKALKALGRWQDGLDAIERALSLAYGPRKIGLMTLKADLLLGAERRGEALSLLEEQLAAYRALPAGQRQPAAEARVEARLRELSGAAPPAPRR